MTENKTYRPKCRKISSKLYFFWILASFFIFMIFSRDVMGEEMQQAAFYYENACASCEGDKEFFEIFRECIPSERKEALQIEPVSYNVFLDSCSEKYEEEAKRLDIPQETELPVMILGDHWYAGYDSIREGLEAAAAGDTEAGNEADGKSTETVSDRTQEQQGENRIAVSEVIRESTAPVVLLFITNSCDSCHKVEQWFEEKASDAELLEYNIVEDDCLDLLKSMFRIYGIQEKDQQVPAVFFADQWRTGDEEITALSPEVFQSGEGNRELLQRVEQAENQAEEKPEELSLPMLAGAGFLAGLNPCSISMLLMLLSLILSEKRSVWKSGLLYLTGKYAAYFAIGMGIYFSASRISQQVLDQAGQVIYKAAAVLFLAAGVLYTVDAVRVYHQEYGKIRTQLPVGMRRMNHRMIRKFAEKKGALWPLLIVALGIAISLGEFFCTGQIYMAAITYMLKDHVNRVWIPFLVYVTAMSLPACIMVILIQRTRNTEAVSDFMLRRLGSIKLFNAVLFFGFAVYFLFR